MKHLCYLLGFLLAAAGFMESCAALVALNQADYAIVVNSTLRDAQWENQLIALKEAQGLSVGLLNVTDADFSNLSTAYSQKRIRDELIAAYTSGGKKLKYILLVGDANVFASSLMATYQGTSASKNLASAKYLNFIPGPSRTMYNSDPFNKSDILGVVPPVGDPNREGWTGDMTANENGMIPSDDFYGNFEGDMTLSFSYNPSIPSQSQPHIVSEAIVGRVPVRNISEMRSFVTKLVQYNSALTVSSTTVLPLQKNILGAIDNAASSWTSPGLVLYPFVNEFRKTLPTGFVLNNVTSTGSPNIFNKNNDKYLLTLYSSVSGGYHLAPFMDYRTKYPTPDYYSIHDQTGNPSTSDDDIDDYPTITDGSYTVFVAPICDRLDFDGIDQNDRAIIKSMILGTAYYDGIFNKNNDMWKDILFTPSRGAIGVVGVRYNSLLTENQAFTMSFINAVSYGESVLGRACRNAKLYSQAMYPGNKSRNNASESYGDILLLGDPAMVLNIPNQGAALANPSSLTLLNDAGSITASWPSVAGATGYSVSIGNFSDIPYWTYSTKTNSIAIRATPPGMPLMHGETYYVTVKPFVQQGTDSTAVPCFARNSGIVRSVVADVNVSPATYAGAFQQHDGTIVVYIGTSPDTNIKGYKIYRQTDKGYNTTLITNTYTATTSFIDHTPPCGVSLKYVVTALDFNNNESAPLVSNVAFAIPQSAPGMRFVNGTQTLAMSDVDGNLFLLGTGPTGSGTGLRFYSTVTTNGATISYSGDLCATSLTFFQRPFLFDSANLTGGLTFRNNSGQAMMHINNNGEVHLWSGVFNNTWW